MLKRGGGCSTAKRCCLIELSEEGVSEISVTPSSITISKLFLAIHSTTAVEYLTTNIR